MSLYDDRYGREIPDEEYTAADFERRVALRARTHAVAKHLTNFLKKTDHFDKTFVFCVDQEHAGAADELRKFPAHRDASHRLGFFRKMGGTVKRLERFRHEVA